MQIGMVGLGRMGSAMSRRLLRAGHAVVVYDVDPEPVARLAAEGAAPASSVAALVGGLSRPRVVWLMVPAGPPTQDAIDSAAACMHAGDTIVDGGNSRYTDSIGRASRLAGRGISLLDVGTSGGVWGLDHGYGLMAGGDEAAFERLRPLFAALAPEGGYARVGPSGAGHFVKMVHNGVEYALMQAYAEGFELLEASDLGVDPAQVAELWRHGTVVRSWLLDLAAAALRRDPALESVTAAVDDSGEGRWTLEEAAALGVPVPGLAAALFTRFASRRDDAFSNRLLSALRREFGGHAAARAETPA